MFAYFVSWLKPSLIEPRLPRIDWLLSGAERGRNLMKAERWEKVHRSFQSALERPPEERAAFLDETCHDDEGMRREVEFFAHGP